MTVPEALRRLQADFAEAMRHGNLPGFVPYLAGDPAMAGRRLAIYRDAIFATRRAALLAAYPVVARIVGEAFFGEAVRRFGGAVLPDDGDLNRYGGSFPAFLAAYPHAVTMPWLPDVAALEWAWHESLAAADAPQLDFAALAQVPEGEQPRLRLVLHPSVRVVRSAWPVLAIWEANQPDRDGKPEREEGADDVLVWREARKVRLARLSPPEAAFVQGLGRGLALEDAADVEGDWDLPALLRRLAQGAMLCGHSTAAAGGA